MKRLLLATIMVFLLTGVSFAQDPPAWVKTSLSFPVRVVAPTANCDGSELLDLGRVDVIRFMDGDAGTIIASISPITPGQIILVDQTCPQESESVQFGQIAYDTVGNSSEDCGGVECRTEVGAVRIPPGCAGITVPE